jgi:hypothetical protein
MIPDSGWLAALNLPTKVVAGVFIALCVTLGLDIYEYIDLSSIGSLTRLILVLLCVLFGGLLFASLVELAAQPKIAKMKTTLLAERRKDREDEKAAEREAARQRALANLDHLSAWELRIVADALKEGSPSFYTYAHSSPVAQLQAKNLVYSPGGTHHQDHYPFTFHDFAWKVLLQRKDEFLTKAEEAEEREKPKKARGARRR